MNIFLLEPKQLLAENTACLNVNQSVHAKKILKVNIGDSVRVGLINGNTGLATVTSINETVDLAIQHLNTAPAPQRSVTLILALPRPQMIKRVLQTVACMGVEKLCLIQTAKVEKSFWQSPSMSEAEIHKQLLLGLEQGVATQLPSVEKYQRFRPFVEDHLATLAEGKTKLIAHPGEYPSTPRLASSERSVFAIGPEGGFIQKEVDYFTNNGFEPVSMGSRILKVENAVTAVLATLYDL